MAMPASGCIAIITCPNNVACTSIAQAVDGNVTPPKSLSTVSVTAGKTAPHGMTEFYTYAPATGSISVSVSSSEIYDGMIEFNTITASGAWTATKSDPNNIISSFSASGSGNGKISAAGSSPMPSFYSEAVITYCLTSAPTTKTTWTLIYYDELM